MAKNKIWNMGVRKLDNILRNRKSRIVKKAAKTLDLPVIDVKLSQSDPLDLRGFPILPTHPADREIKAGNFVLMEYAAGQVVTVLVEEIVDGIAYGTDDSGESYCAPLDNCDKVPF